MNETDVLIRPVTEQDTDKIILWRNSPAVQNNFIYRVPLTREAHLGWLKNQVRAGQVAQFVIYSKAIEKDVGSVFLRNIDHKNQKAEFGIFIGEDFARGKGIGSHAARLILQYGFENLNLNRIFLRVFARNIGAINAYKKAGFVQEGLLRQDVIIDGEKEDMVLMSVLRTEYFSKQIETSTQNQ
jgi:RimJ/RimL family protein N-acetyltransferase